MKLKILMAQPMIKIGVVEVDSSSPNASSLTEILKNSRLLSGTEWREAPLSDLSSVPTPLMAISVSEPSEKLSNEAFLDWSAAQMEKADLFWSISSISGEEETNILPEMPWLEALVQHAQECASTEHLDRLFEAISEPMEKLLEVAEVIHARVKVLEKTKGEAQRHDLTHKVSKTIH